MPGSVSDGAYLQHGGAPWNGDGVARPLIATKLYVPKLRRGLVARPRLLERLGRGAEARLTLVSAPAGFGKTTLLAEWLGEVSADGHSVAWLSLDPADNEPASFWTYVVTALQGAVPSVGSRCAGAHRLLPVADRPRAHHAAERVGRSAGRVCGWCSTTTTWSTATMSATAWPSCWSTSRPTCTSCSAPAPTPTCRWPVGGCAASWSRSGPPTCDSPPTEADAYLNEVTGLDLAAADIAVLEERTEGWIAALQLAALSLQGREDVSGFIARFAGDDRYIVDYLVEEVLAHQPDAVRDFLLQSAVLDRLDRAAV